MTVYNVIKLFTGHHTPPTPRPNRPKTNWSPPPMTPDQTDLWLEIQHRQMQALERLASAVERLAPSTIAAPNYQHPLEEFTTFDWSSIGATVERVDRHGAAVVNWRGFQFVRRSPSNKFDPAIWFSRCTGKDDNGSNQYERLVTFKPVSRIEVEPVPDKVRYAVGQFRENQF